MILLAPVAGCAGGSSSWGAYDHSRVAGCTQGPRASRWAGGTECGTFGTARVSGGAEDLLNLGFLLLGGGGSPDR